MTDDAELEAQIRARDAAYNDCDMSKYKSIVAVQDRRTLLRLLDEARAEYQRLATRLNDAAKAETEHCKNCCCAQLLKALGITEYYTAKSIPEHIADTAARLEKAQEKNVVLLAALDWVLNWHIAPTDMKVGKLGWGHAPSEAICDALNQSRDRIMASPCFPRLDMSGVDDA